MRLLKTAFHPDVSEQDILPASKLTVLERYAARAIVLREEDILLLYTERYQDYSLPGGGLGKGEDEVQGLKRELQEETGARQIRNVQPFARYDEYRPWYKDDADIIYMVSYCYSCDIADELGDTSYETYEISNSMKPLWINIHTAIKHNEVVIAESDRKGLSIERETFLLKTIVDELLNG